MLLKHKGGSLCQSKTPNKHRQKKTTFCDPPWTEALLARLQPSLPVTYLIQAPGSTQSSNGFSHEVTGVLVHPAAKGIFYASISFQRVFLKKHRGKKQKFQISHRFHSLSSRLEPWSQTFQKETDTRSRRREYFLCHHIGRSYLVLLQYQIEAVWAIFFVTETLNGLQLFFMLVHGNAHTRTHMRIDTERQRHTHTHKSTLFMTQRHVCRVACWSKAHGILLSHLPLERAR